MSEEQLKAFIVAKENLASYSENLSDEDLEAAAGGRKLKGAACSTFLTAV